MVNGLKKIAIEDAIKGNREYIIFKNQKYKTKDLAVAYGCVWDTRIEKQPKENRELHEHRDSEGTRDIGKRNSNTHSKRPGA